MLDNSKIVHVYCDGGSRGNPGKSASAFVVLVDGKEIYSNAYYLGIETNNFAEYSAALFALKWINDNHNILENEITFVLDSELVVKQINGLYKIKNEKLKKIYLQIMELLEHFKNISGKKRIFFTNIEREKNERADYLVNQKLNSIS